MIYKYIINVLGIGGLKDLPEAVFDVYELFMSSSQQS